MTEPDDRELQDYLKGDSPLSQSYRKASAETTPPLLDEVILARARAAVKRKPDWSRALAPYALAASLLLGVNLAWNVYQEHPQSPTAVATERAERLAPLLNDLASSGATAEVGVEAETSTRTKDVAPVPDPAPAAPAPVLAKSKANAEVEAKAEADAASGARARKSMAMQESARLAPSPMAADSGLASESNVGDARPPEALTEEQTIERLLDYLGALQGAVFIRNGDAHSPADAVEHLRLKRRKAGARVRTAEEFIDLCATRSSVSGTEYQIRFDDGRTEPAAAVLRRRLDQLRQ